MSCCEYTPGRDVDFVFAGVSYSLSAGEHFQIPFTDPCQIRDFVRRESIDTNLDY